MLVTLDQTKLKELGISESLEISHIAVLDAIQSLYASKSTLKIDFNEETYALIPYDFIIQICPSFGFSKLSVKKAIDRLISLKFLKENTDLQKKNASYLLLDDLADHYYGLSVIQKEKKENAIIRVKSDADQYSKHTTEIIEYLNRRTGMSYKTNSRKTRSLITARFHEGFKKEDFIAVIDDKVQSWLHSPERAEYLRPITLFSLEKFEGYVQTAKMRSVAKEELKPIDPDSSEGRFIDYWKNTVLSHIPLVEDLERDHIWVKAYEELRLLKYGKVAISNAVEQAKKSPYWAEKLINPMFLVEKKKGIAAIASLLISHEASIGREQKETAPPAKQYESKV